MEVNQKSKTCDFKKSNDVNWKSETDPVTIADLQAQYIIYSGIKSVYNDLEVIGEEALDTMIESEFDFSLCNSTNIDDQNLYNNINYNIEDCCVWIDP